MSKPGTRKLNVARKLFFFVGIPLVTSCSVFILLYILTPTIRVPVGSTDVVQPVKQVASSTAETSPAVAVVRTPVRLAIETINVNASVKPTGLTSTGDMAVDDSISDLWWYQLGYRPGQKGSAVIAGHYGWRAGVAAVFNDIHSLQPGDKIISYDDEDKATTFIVREIRIYDPQADATDVFKSTDGKAHLNLITCQGSWVNAEDSYSNRLVVFTDAES